MNSKKRYIPIIALGALLLSLLAILPLAGVGEVRFIDPDDINSNNTGRLIDTTPEDQESTRQGGQVGILYEDDDLNRPVRRALVFPWDGHLAVGGGQTDFRGTELADVVAHSNMLKNVQLRDYDGDTADDQLLSAGDYVYVGNADPGITATDLRTVRKVTSVTRTEATRTQTDLHAQRYDITLDAAFPTKNDNQNVWRIKNSLTSIEEFRDNYRFISAAAVTTVSGDQIRLSAPVVPSGVGNFDGGVTAAKRLGGETDTRLSTDDVIVGIKDGTVNVDPPGSDPAVALVAGDESQIDRVSSDRIEMNGDFDGTGNVYVVYWAAERNSTGGDITVQSQASTQPQGFTLQETAEDSDEFSGKIDLIPASVSVPWSEFANPYTRSGAGTESDPYVWTRTTAVGATVTLTTMRAGKSALKVKYPSGWNLTRNDDGDQVPAARPSGSVTVRTVPDFSQRDSGTGQLIPRLPVNETDTVTVNYPDGSGALRVETAKPVFSNFAPAHNSVGDDSRPTVSAQVTDSDSGLEEKEVGVIFMTKVGANQANYPTAGDRGVKIAPNDADADEIAGGFEVEARLDSNEALSGDGEIWWWVKATDKAGNVAYSDRQPNTSAGVADPCAATTEAELLTDAQSDSVGCDPYVIKVDGTKPKMAHAETGRWWDASLSTGDSDDKTEYRRNKARRDSILVIFNEHLDPASVQASDFEVNDATPSSADVHNVKVRDDNIVDDDTETEDIDESSGDGNSELYVANEIPQFVGNDRGYVFLTLSQDMTPNAQPKVEMVDKVSDLAGNQQSTLQRDAQANDRIAPTLTVTIEEGVRPVTNKSVTVRITSDENIGEPDVFYYKVDKTSPVDNPDTTGTDESTGASETTITGEQAASANFVSAKEHTATLTPSSDGLYTVYVTAVDSAGNNLGVTGDKTVPIDLDSDTKAILFERDKAIASPDFDPDKDGVNTTFETDDPSGFIRIDYSKEASEYSSTTVAVDTTTTPHTPGRSGDDLDTHGRLTIVSATFDGEDISGDLNANTDGNIFQYHLDGAAVGEYDLEVTVSDEAGNRNAAPHKGTIKVIERKPYKLTLNPGWNLVSLPGSPADTDINEVIPADHPIEAVRGYDPMVPGAWLIAEEGGDGTFTGTLETIEAGTAYWIKTGSFEALEVNIPKPTPGSLSLLPTIQISQGWNLVPILDVDGDFTLADQTANDNYFSGLTAGSIAAIYTYNTVTNSWMSVSETGVELGRGYWVYATKPGVIVP